MELTGITEEMVVEGIPHQELARIIKELFTPDTLIVAYNLAFDISFVHHLMKRYVPDFAFRSDVLDLLTVYKDTHDYPHRLENALETYGIPIESAHRAFDDAYATKELLEILLREKDAAFYINHIGYHKNYPFDKVRYDHITYHPQSFEKGSLRTKILHAKRQEEPIPH